MISFYDSNFHSWAATSNNLQILKYNRKIGSAYTANYKLPTLLSERLITFSGVSPAFRPAYFPISAKLEKRFRRARA